MCISNTTDTDINFFKISFELLLAVIFDGQNFNLIDCAAHVQK